MSGGICYKGFEKMFPTLSDLMLYSDDHVQDGPFVCKSCDIEFPQLISFQKHVLLHEGKKFHSCRKCGKTFSQLANLRNHIAAHANGNGVSSDTRTKKLSDVMVPESFVLRPEENPSENITTIKQEVIEHVEVNGTVSELEADSLDQRSLADTKNDTDIQQYEKVNDQSPAKINASLGDSENSAANLTNGNNLKKLKRAEKNPKGRKKYICDFCGKRLPKKSKLVIHRRIHTGEKPFSCTVCGKAFRCNTSLTVHSRIHTDIKNHECTVCTKRFYTSSELKSHQRTHTGERPFSCKVCGKKFTLLRTLSAHRVVHTGEKPFFCEICGTSFSYIGCWRRHMDAHKNIGNHVCDECGKPFTSLRYLRIHIQTHSKAKSFSCDLCDRVFTNPGNFKIHMRFHSNYNKEKLLFYCDTCGKAYSTRKSLANHNRVRYCESCDQSFSCAVVLESHEQVHLENRKRLLKKSVAES